MKRKLLIIIPTAVLCTIIVLTALLFFFLTIVEYRPKSVEKLPFTSGDLHLEIGKKITLFDWNIGYAGLGKDEDFFMDGGKSVRQNSKKVVQNYLKGIQETIASHPADIVFLQEIDIKSHRTWKINQFNEIQKSLNYGGAYALNFKCNYVPFPLPPIGRVESGVATFTNYETIDAERRSLPVPFKWPVRIANLKRCMLVTRIPLYNNGEKTGQELVLVDFHLEAFDNGEAKIAQTKALKEFIVSEYEKGNYVISGGDFNQRFPGSTAYPILSDKNWHPGQLDSDALDEGWQFVFDDSKPTCRANGAPYNDENAREHNWQYYVIDGFLISPNVQKISINVLDEDFQNSDHNPIFMTFMLK